MISDFSGVKLLLTAVVIGIDHFIHSFCKLAHIFPYRREME
jgi:hypothetical protein